jgi:hypothetical protein
MTALDALQSVQFVTVNGRRLAILDAADFDTVIEWLETVEDGKVVQQALAELKAAGGNRAKAGWLKWEDVEGQLG